jgi:UDP-N-acetylmuramoyl-L-alanyl-D-glutamate--2,6-diaminopimelate ligase
MWQKIKNRLFHLSKSIFYNYYYHWPSKKLTLIGVTGTDGKTTTSILLYEILKKSGINAGVITTIGAKYGNEEIDTGLHITSPDPSVIQKIFKKMVDAGVTHVVCEVTAHALDQFRYYGCNFEVSVITNTSHEHLDYFHDMNRYIKTKSLIFSQSKISILNRDDDSYQTIKNSLVSKSIITYSIKQPSDYQAKKIKLNKNSLSFNLNNLKIKTNSPYYYQTYNILAAIAVIEQLKINPKYALETIKNFPDTKGRREEVSNQLDILALIDFAHTPNAIKNTLSSLRKIGQNRILTIFGATGGRDQTKRPIMGNIVSQLADIAFITADDTRNENINQINQQIISGISNDSILIDHNQPLSEIKKTIRNNKNKFIYFNIPNRQDAFNLAVSLAQAKDIIIAMGKGHETTILDGNTEYPWSEAEAFRTAFKLRQADASI